MSGDSWRVWSDPEDFRDDGSRVGKSLSTRDKSWYSPVRVDLQILGVKVCTLCEIDTFELEVTIFETRFRDCDFWDVGPA